MKIAVVGSNGLVGNAVQKKLNATGINRENYQEHIGKKFDVVINANGNSHKWVANDNPIYDFGSNVESVYRTIFDFKAKLYIYISSYDAARDNTYGLHKNLGESIVKHYTNYIILRCPIILGKEADKGFLFDAINEEPLYVSKDSEYQVITNVELASIIKVLIDKEISGVSYNVGSTDTLRVGDLSILLNKSIAFREDAKYEEYKEDVSEICRVYKMKRAAQYVKDVV